MNAMSTLAVAFLLAATSPSLWKGARGAQSLMEPSVLANPQQLLAKLEEGQPVFLEKSLVVLNETVFVDASNVEIRGAPGMTTVQCPEQGGAFVVRGTNVTMVNLNITGCKNGSAVTVGVKADPLAEKKEVSTQSNAESVERLEVRVESCVFTNNSNSEGAAISATRSQLLICKSLFSDNKATLGGAIRASSGSLHIRQCEFERNTATSGGALYAVGLEATFRDVLSR